MSPTNQNLDMVADEVDQLDLSPSRQPIEPPEFRGMDVRTKRIRNARRSNTANGMQRRRNKRMAW